MAASTPSAPSIEPSQRLPVNEDIASFERWCRYQNLSERTVAIYSEAGRQFFSYAARQGMPVEPEHVRREHIEAWLLSLRDTGRSDATVKQRFMSFRRFWAWAVEDGLVKESPMGRMPVPRVIEQPVECLDEEQQRALIRTCAGTAFEEKRDAALIRMLLDSGLRLHEVATLRWSADPDRRDVDLDQRVMRVFGKGRRCRAVPIGNKAARAVDVYVRARARHPHADEERLWIGRRGGVTDSGLYQIVRRRGREAGLGEIHPHQLRHSFADSWLRGGGSEGDLQRIAGWSSPAMLQRYGAARAEDRAIEAHRTYSPGDRL